MLRVLRTPQRCTPRRCASSFTTKRPTLHYFNVRARGEVIRLLLEESGVSYDFKAITPDNIVELKQSGKLPFGQVPYYEDEHVAVAQSGTIARYLAKKHSMFGSNEAEAIHIDEIYEGTLDLQAKLRTAAKIDETKKSEARQELLEKTLPLWLGHFEKLLVKNSRTPLFPGFAVGTKLSLADLALFNIVDNVVILAPDSLSKFPRLKTHHELISERPRVQMYLTSDRRPKR